MTQKVLIINSDPFITSHINDCFRVAGFQLFHANDNEEGLQLIKEEEPTVILLDLDCTRYLAFDFCRTLRMKNENWTPLILLSAEDEEFDLVLGLELGADDFIRKPIRPKELVARVKSILRRQHIVWPKRNSDKTSSVENKDDLIINGDITIMPSNYTVYVKDVRVELTMKEFEVLLYLSKKKGTPISREELLSVVGDDRLLVEPRVIDVFISRIREKIEPCRSKPTYIKTVRSIGYMMREQQILTM
jgi:DNA-binding response OmpR family regulator